MSFNPKGSFPGKRGGKTEVKLANSDNDDDRSVFCCVIVLSLQSYVKYVKVYCCFRNYGKHLGCKRIGGVHLLFL